MITTLGRIAPGAPGVVIGRPLVRAVFGSEVVVVAAAPVFTSSAKARRPKPREGARVNARSDRVHMAIWVQFKVAKGLIRQWIEIKEGYSLEIVPFFLL